MRSRDLKRTNSQGRNEEGDKGKGNSSRSVIMGAVRRTEIGTEGTAKTGAMGVARGSAEGMPTSAATLSPSKVSANRETDIQIKGRSPQGVTQIHMYKKKREKGRVNLTIKKK